MSRLAGNFGPDCPRKPDQGTSGKRTGWYKIFVFFPSQVPWLTQKGFRRSTFHTRVRLVQTYIQCHGSCCLNTLLLWRGGLEGSWLHRMISQYINRDEFLFDGFGSRMVCWSKCRNRNLAQRWIFKIINQAVHEESAHCAEFSSFEMFSKDIRPHLCMQYWRSISPTL